MRIWLLITMLFAAPAFATQPQQAALQNTMDALKSQQEKAQEISKQAKQVNQDVKKLQSKGDALVQKIRSQQSKIVTAREDIKRLERERTAKAVLLDDQRDQLTRLLSGMIRMRRLPPHTVSAQPAELPVLLQTASALNITYNATHQAFERINQEYLELDALKAELQARQALLNADLQQVQGKQTELSALIKERRKTQQSLQRDHAKVVRRVKELSDKSGNLQELIARLESETKLFETITPRAKPSAPSKSQAFSARKGNLPYPATGKLLHRFGEKRNDEDTYQGMELKTEPSAPVTAPHAGKVVFSGSFMDYGPMVIIEHDRTYHSVIAGLDVVAVEPGQPVGRDELVGTMGASANARTLYFELRKHSKAIDPRPWMGNVSLASR